MIKKLAFLMFLGSPLLASGPKYSFSDPHLSDELNNAYHDIVNVPNGTYKASSMTLQGITVDSITINSFQGGLTLGKVVQVVKGATDTTQTNVGSTSFSDTGTSATITPLSASNKVLVIAVSQRFGNIAANSSDATIVRNGSNIGDATFGLTLVNSDATNTFFPITMVVLDSPATTSSVTYKVQIRVPSAGTAVWNTGAGAAYIILIEIS